MLSFKYSIIYILFYSILLSSNEIQFSANILKNVVEDKVEKRIFKDNVIIKKNDMTLFSDNATYIPDSNKVILIDNVKMYSGQDSLECNNLVLYDKIDKEFIAEGDVNFYKINQLIKCEYLDYKESLKGKNLILHLHDNAQLIDSSRMVFGDTLNINYEDSLINNIYVLSNAKFINYRFAQYGEEKKSQKIEDNMTSKKMFIDFYNGDPIKMQLSGMATTTFNVVEDMLVMGRSISSGDSIDINIFDNIIDRMQMFGGVQGIFEPEKNNSRVDSTVVYSAEHIDYQVNNEISYLYNNAVLNYDYNELKSEEIFVDWEANLLETKTKDSVFPSINGFGESPIYGERMEFDLISKKGKITKGKTEFNESFYTGKTITKQKDELYYINNSIFTTCDLDDPHYYFHSNKMKMIPDDRIIAKPMILYIQELPIFYMPFAVFPNKNGDRISGWIMPSFGHRSNTGTYLDNLGYYYVINDYSDYTFLFDIHDKKGIITKHDYRYKRRAGKYWYNYYLDGYFISENKYYLADNDNDISNLFGETSQTIHNIHWKHKQSFDPTQHLIINYRYKSELDSKEINLNNRLEQNQLTTLSYQKRWTRNSISIGFEEYEDLYIAPPSTIEQINIYKWFTGPKISFSLPQRKIFGNGDKWHNDIYLSYNLSYDHGKESYTKNSCIDNNEDKNCDDISEDYIIEETDTFNWAPNDSHDIRKGGAKNIIQLSMSRSLSWLTISPRINITEDWAFEYRERNLDGTYNNIPGFNRRLTWNSSLSLNTKMYGIIPFNIGDFVSIRHKISPQITISYSPNLINSYQQQFKTYIEDGETYSYDILGGAYAKTLTSQNKKIRFSLGNIFQAKKEDIDGNINKIDLLNIFMTFDYGSNGQDKDQFSLIDSKWSFKKSNGGELFFVHMQHNMYDKNTNDLLLKKGKIPELESLRFQMSSNFRLNGYSIKDADNNQGTISSQDTTKYNSLLFMDEFKPEIENNEIWRSDLNVSIQGDYNIEAKKWEFNYFNLDTYNTMHLTKNWLFTYATGINLMDMKINSQSIKLYRELHCWEFMFTWWPDGFSKGFQLNINIKHPDLKDVRVRSSSTNRKFVYN